MELSRSNSHNLLSYIADYIPTDSDPIPVVEAKYRIDEFGETCASSTTKQKKLSDSEVLDIISKYNAGVSTYDLANEYGCCRSNISHALKSHGIQVDKAWAQRKFDTDEVIQMFRNGVTIADISRHYGVSNSPIRKCLKDRNLL